MLNTIHSFFSDKRTLIINIQNSGLYFLGSVVQSVFAVITQPIYSIYLSAEEFGIIGYFEAIKHFFTPIFILSMTSVYLMRYFKQSEKDNKKMLFNITFYLLFINTITLFIGYITIYIYFINMGLNIPINPFAWYILVALLLDNIKLVVLINFRIRKKAFSYFTFSLINTFFSIGFGLLFVAVLKWGAEGRMLAPIIATMVLLPYCLYILNKYTEPYFDFKFFFRGLRVAFPLILAAYAYVPISNVDRIFLERLNNLSELGLYNIGITIAGYVQLFYIAMGMAFEPDIFQSVAQRNYKKLIKVFIIIFVPYFIVIFIFMAFSETIINLLTAGRYLGARVYTNISIISVFFMGVYWFFDKTLIAMGRTKLNLLVNVIGGASSILVMYIAIANYGFLGAAYSKVLISLIMLLLSGYFVFNFSNYCKTRITTTN